MLGLVARVISEEQAAAGRARRGSGRWVKELDDEEDEARWVEDDDGEEWVDEGGWGEYDEKQQTRPGANEEGWEGCIWWTEEKDFVDVGVQARMDEVETVLDVKVVHVVEVVEKQQPQPQPKPQPQWPRRRIRRGLARL